MKSKLLVLSFVSALTMVGVILSLNHLALGEEPAGKPAGVEKIPFPAAGTKMEVGNKICPISGEKIIEGKESKVEYKGKIYNLCCSMCEKDFKKDPEAAIKKLEMMEKEKMEGKEEENDMDDDDMPGMKDKNMNMEMPGVGN